MCLKNYQKFLIVFIILLMFFSFHKVFGASTFDFNTGVKTWNDKDIHFHMIEGWLSNMEATPYWNDNYYKVVFQESNSNNTGRVWRAWFISKTDPNLNLGNNTCPFYFEIGTGGAPGNVARACTVPNIGNVTIYDYYYETWSGGNRGNGSFTNDNPSYNVRFEYDSNLDYVDYYFYSDYDSCLVNIGGVNYQFNYGSYITPYIDGFSSDNTVTSPMNYITVEPRECWSR